MGETLNFKVSTGLKSILGQDLITDDYVAILELVKNSYDAGARKVIITFESDSIIIADDGKGMTLDDIRDKWLFIAYSAKKAASESSYRDHLRRHYAGAKGIGRMSCDRLGKKLILETCHEKGEFERLYIDWSLFEQDQNKEFAEIGLPHQTSEREPIFPNSAVTGTRLQLFELRKVWDREDKKRLRRSLEKMINPFSEIDDFEIVVISENDKFQDTRETEDYNKINGPIKNNIREILEIKTTEIKSWTTKEHIHTRVSDRGELMYEIFEPNPYDHVKEATISLFYLNRAAKVNFSRRMGVTPTQYGSIFLFRNNFRILPYGDVGDDSFGLDRRAMQGYNRYIGTRDLFGRIDLHTDDLERFKEVSSRNAGLIDNKASRELFEYFEITHRRLERYVAGVLWGDKFLSREYFKSMADADKARKELQNNERESETTSHLYHSPGSRVDFMQLVRSLAQDKNITIVRYNEALANIVSNAKEYELLQDKLLADFEDLANKTSSQSLKQSLSNAKATLEQLAQHKAELEQQLKDAEVRRNAAERLAKESQKQKEEADKKKQEAEKERDAQIVKNQYLSSVRNTSKEVEDIVHTILISSTNLSSIINLVSMSLEELGVHQAELSQQLDRARFQIERIVKLASMVTKADSALLREASRVDLKEYIREYLDNFRASLNISIVDKSNGELLKRLPLLELSVVLDNLVSNAVKADAKKLLVIFHSTDDRAISIDFADDGCGVDLALFTPKTIFEEGVTNRRGGSGIGLSTIKEQMKRNLNGDIEFLGNGLHFPTGATFRLILK
ncbi:ATP-binding protein [Porphyromonas cangingivalis]|uniref:Signal transduction histidine kinase n=1 Tax=Porphyromonas cangingivalis TaxID=36874 RepID=A0A1T4NNR1_PORCN|nr:ATP-binding protein [Porphyromonas cangingivalis]SJZ80931.1 Signal transduction histidine kinase [Porphyromonas cangingivalis]VEJ03641.1 DNA mismatch repair protein [Porphyromonas cangingivalis]